MRLWLKNLSLTLEDFAESAAKIIAAHEKSLDSLAKVVPDNSILDDLLAEQEGVYAVANTTYRTWINTSGEVETQLYKITEQATWLKKVMPLVGSSFELSDSDWFGFWGPWLRSGHYPVCKSHSNLPGTLYSLKSFKCVFAATNHQANNLPKTGTSDKEWKEWLISKLWTGSCGLRLSQRFRKKVMPCESHTGSVKAVRNTERSLRVVPMLYCLITSLS